MFNSFGNIFRITTSGESHGRAMTVIVDGVPPNIELSEQDIQKELDKRRPGQSNIVTPRAEEDKVEILSGIFDGKTTGAPIAMIVRNKDADSSKYETLKDVFRPGHAGFTYTEKYGIYDYKGGGRSSARETLNWVAAGAIAKKILSQKKIKVTAYVKELGGIKAEKINLDDIRKNPVNCPDMKAAKKMEAAILKAKSENNSLGGIIEIISENVPAGLGDPVFLKLEAQLAYALMSINAVKGVEIGAGFAVADMKGSECNDLFEKKSGKIITKTNNSGGILGGISNGMPIIARIAVKPTSSIAQEQETIDIHGKKRKIKVEGRHDPAVIVRATVIAEAMTSIVLVDALLRQRTITG